MTHSRLKESMLSLNSLFFEIATLNFWLTLSSRFSRIQICFWNWEYLSWVPFDPFYCFFFFKMSFCMISSFVFNCLWTSCSASINILSFRISSFASIIYCYAFDDFARVIASVALIISSLNCLFSQSRFSIMDFCFFCRCCYSS